MRNNVLAMILAFSACDVGAQTWVSVASGDDVFIYIDIASLKKDGARETAWFLYEYLNPRNEAGGAYHSRLSQYLIDCAKGEYAARQRTAYAGPGASGESLFSNNYRGKEAFEEPAPGTIGATMITAACAWVSKRPPAVRNYFLGDDTKAHYVMPARTLETEHGRVRSMLVSSTLLGTKGKANLPYRSSCSTYLVDCGDRKLRQFPRQAEYREAMCRGEEVGENDIAGVPEGMRAPTATWERKLVSLACELNAPLRKQGRM